MSHRYGSKKTAEEKTNEHVGATVILAAFLGVCVVHTVIAAVVAVHLWGGYLASIAAVITGVFLVMQYLKLWK